MIFDVSDEGCRIENELATKLMHKYNVYINIRRKPKQGITSVVVKGIERCAGTYYILCHLVARPDLVLLS